MSDDEDFGRRPSMDSLMSRLGAAETDSLSTKEDALAEYVEQASDVAARAAQDVRDCKEAAARADALAVAARDKADAAKNQSETTSSNVKIAFAVAGAFVVLILAGLGWLLNKNFDQIQALESESTRSATVLTHAESDISKNVAATASHEAERRALEARVRDLEEEVRVLSALLRSVPAAQPNKKSN